MIHVRRQQRNDNPNVAKIGESINVLNQIIQTQVLPGLEAAITALEQAQDPATQKAIKLGQDVMKILTPFQTRLAKFARISRQLTSIKSEQPGQGQPPVPGQEPLPDVTPGTPAGPAIPPGPATGI